MQVDMPIFLHEISLDEFSVRAALLHGTRWCLVWDTLSCPGDKTAISARCADHQTIVVYSHADWDHAWGTAALPHNTPIVAHDLCAQRFRDEVPQTLAEFRSQAPSKWAEVKLTPPVMTFTQASRIDLGGLTVRLQHLPGHTPDSIVAFSPELNLLLAGDTVEWPCPCVPEDCDLEAWITALASGVNTLGCASYPVTGQKAAKNCWTTPSPTSTAAPRAPLDMPPMSDFYARTHRTTSPRKTLT
jgi:hypothetical protein